MLLIIVAKVGTNRLITHDGDIATKQNKYNIKYVLGLYPPRY